MKKVKAQAKSGFLVKMCIQLHSNNTYTYIHVLVKQDNICASDSKTFVFEIMLPLVRYPKREIFVSLRLLARSNVLNLENWF